MLILLKLKFNGWMDIEHVEEFYISHVLAPVTRGSNDDVVRQYYYKWWSTVFEFDITKIMSTILNFTQIWIPKSIIDAYTSLIQSFQGVISRTDHD